MLLGMILLISQWLLNSQLFSLAIVMDLDRSLWLIVGFNGGFKKFQGQKKLHHL